jgi:two-component system sensor histidine kinase KdpD
LAEPRRPDPDALLAHVAAEETAVGRGRLKIFFGAVAGVGKTFAMLEAARLRRREGVDVVVGYIETHRRRETEALLQDLELLPRRHLQYRSVLLEEFDLDAALARRPQLILVDELAHTNAEGSRHARRWQDVQELLAAGIDVYTTLNVQHLESLNDVVARITHVQVRETVPDAVIERADEVELVDLPPEELLKRLREGKVYIAPQAQRAIDYFFRKGNLIALRQLALRTVAERVDAQMRTYRSAHGVAETWPVAERIVVGVGPSPSARQVVRATRRLADRLDAEWTAVFIETPGYASWSAADRDRVWQTLRLAEELGGHTASVSGANAGELLVWARAHNATKIVVGKPSRRDWRERLFGSSIDSVIHQSGDVDVYVISGEEEQGTVPARALHEPSPPLRSWLGAAGVVAAATVLALLLRDRVDLSTLIMLYLLAVVVVATRFERRVALAASAASVAALDFFCVPPYYTFAVSDTRHFPLFAVMLLVAMVISTLTARLRRQAGASLQRERRSAALYEMSRELARAPDSRLVVEAGARHVAETFESAVAILLPDPFGTLKPLATVGEVPMEDANETAVARWVQHNSRSAGLGTDTLPSARAMYLPLVVSGTVTGVLAVRPAQPTRFRDPEQVHLLETFANLIASAIERTRLAAESRRVEQSLELSRLRSEFVNTASHQLRAPLRSVALQLELLHAELADRLPPAELEPLETARETTARLMTLAGELLDLARLEAGAVELHKQALSVREIIQPAVAELRPLADQGGLDLGIEIPDGLPDVSADAAHVGAVVTNLLANAIRHTPPGGTVVVSADDMGEFVQVSVADNGAGIPLEEQAGLFERFTRVSVARGEGGSGLGLAIAREIVRAHGGTIWVDSGPGPGSVFSFTLPVVVTNEPAETPITVTG